MKISKFTWSMPAVVAILMMVAGQMVITTPADALRRTVARCGPRGCAAVSTYRRPVVRPGVRRGVVVVNPRRYWRPGGAIAAGAAIGFVAGAAAVSLAGQPPRAGYCWYYTNASRTTGFWEVCPR